MLNKVKDALRIKSNSHDHELIGLIAAAQMDLLTTGIVNLNIDDPLITMAVIIYCKANFGNTVHAEKYAESYEAIKRKMALCVEYTGIKNDELWVFSPGGELGETLDLIDGYASTSSNIDLVNRCVLIKTIASVDENGIQTVAINDEKSIACGRMSFTESEYYRAKEAGLVPKVVLTIYKDEYEGEDAVRFGGATYNIERTYERTDDLLELHCVERLGGTQNGD